MFERFTNQSRRAVVLAQEEARKLNHNYIGTEHLLLGLLREGKGSAALALKSTDVTLDGARHEVEAITGRGQEQPSGHIPFTGPAKQSLELSLREALQLGPGYIGTGHLLLGLIRQGDNPAVQVLRNLGADLNDLRARVKQELRDHPEQDEAGVVSVGRESRQVRSQPPQEIQVLLDAIDDRLSAIERHLRITPRGPDELRRFDAEIARVRRQKEAAIEAQDFEKAAASRDRESRLRAERERFVREMETGEGKGAQIRPGTEASQAAETSQAAEASEGTETSQAAEASSGAKTETGEDTGPDEIARLRARLTRLEAQLREHDIDPDEPQDPPVAAG